MRCPFRIRVVFMRVFMHELRFLKLRFYPAIASQANEKRHVRARNGIPLFSDIRVPRAFSTARLHCIFHGRKIIPLFQKLSAEASSRVNFSFRPVVKNGRTGTVDRASVADSPSKKKITDNSPKKPEFLRARARAHAISGFAFLCRPAAVLSFCVPARAGVRLRLVESARDYCRHPRLVI